MILVLLFVQANCDLSLPQYTSNIVNVGIQQGGIEDAAADTLQEETMEKLFLFMDEDEQTLVKSCYTLEDGIWTRKNLSSKEKDELIGVLEKPMLAVYVLSSEETASQLASQMGLPEGTDLFQVFSGMPKEQFAKVKEALYEKTADYPDTMLTQAAVAFVKTDYEAQGVDMDALQTRYLFGAGSPK